jgi:hypothetical protein
VERPQISRILCAVLFFCINVTVSAQKIESTLRIGAGYSLYLEKIEKNSIEMNDIHSFDFNFGNTTYFSLYKNNRLFIDADLLFPSRTGLSNYNIYDFSMRVNVLMGYGVCFPIKRLTLYAGVGLRLWGLMVEHTEETFALGEVRYEHFGVKTGIGCMLHVEYAITNHFFVQFSGIFVWDFSDYSSFTAKLGDYAGFSKDYVGFEIRPRFCIGFYLKNEKK